MFKKANCLEVILPGHVVAIVMRVGQTVITGVPTAADTVLVWSVCANDKVRKG
jgi:hypothetical protein